MRVSSVGVALVKEFEGFPNGGRPYRDPVGIWTRGYGRIEGIGPNSPRISEPAASRELLQLLNSDKYAGVVNRLELNLNQNQFDALVSFVYNCGGGAIGSNTTVGRNLRAKNWKGAADGMLAWCKATTPSGQVITLAGLLRRRKAERALFLKPVKSGHTVDFYLTSNESAKIKEMQTLRRAKKNTARRSELKAWMQHRANELSKLDTKKAYRQQRIDILRDVALNRPISY
jgi:GH24 family phage-related lysozyme (muramidase)